MKSVFFIFFIKVVTLLVKIDAQTVQTILVLSSGMSIVVGSFGALFQKKIKKILAYSSINNMGYMLIGLSVNSTIGIKTSLLYAFFYFIAVLIVFMIILNSKEINSEGIKVGSLVYVSDLHKLKGGSKIVLSIFILTLFSLAGIPPLSGFFIKFFILKEAVFCKFYLLALLGAFSSVLSAFYYVYLIKATLFDNKAAVTIEKTENSFILVILLLSFTLVLIFFFPQNIDLFFLFLTKSVLY